MTGRPVRVIVAEDSSTSRALLVELLASDPDVEVVAEAADGERAIELTATLRPSIVVMDIDMPVLDGFEATKRIMAETPTPIVIVTSHHNPHDVELSLQAVRLGALNVLPKPVGPGSSSFEREADRFVAVVKALSDVKVVRRRRPSTVPGDRLLPSGRLDVVGVAASTGGPAALYQLLAELPADIDVPILVVQHIAEGFLPGLVSWLGRGTPLPVTIARHDEVLRRGTVYVAPDGYHLEVGRDGKVMLTSAPPLGGFRPSATKLFESLAQHFGVGVVAVVLTGMGVDGLEGARAVRLAGGRVLAQDEDTSAVFGMPRAVVTAGLAHVVAPVEALAARITGFAERGDRR